MNAIDRFMDKVAVADNGCWEWQAYKEKNGYGRFKFDGKMFQSHRWSYQHHVGEIPESMFVCHKCDNTCCVNPDHLFLGTHQDNTEDMVLKCRHSRGGSHGAAKLCESDVRAIKSMLSKHGRGVGDFLARWFGVSLNQISFIKLGKAWRHIT